MHADRTRIIADEDRRRSITDNRLGLGSLLVDGFAGGRWKITRRRGVATLIIEPFNRLSREPTAALTEEGTRLLAFAAADTRARDIQFTRRR
ncbi:MAG: DNA glycosylase AlkZ-like family protein [Burkholderiales bacterium]